MKKKGKIKKILLLCFTIALLTCSFVVQSSASDEELGDILYTITNGNITEAVEAYPYISGNISLLENMENKFIKVQVEENSEIINPIRGDISGSYVYIYFTGTDYPNMTIMSNGTFASCKYYESQSEPGIVPYKILIYEIASPIVTPTPSTTPVPTPSPTPSPTPVPTPSPTPSPTPDERVTNLLNETENGVGTILTWVGDLWEGITTGEMSTILPVFVIFIAIPLILLVIKIIRKTTWGD